MKTLGFGDRVDQVRLEAIGFHDRDGGGRCSRGCRMAIGDSWLPLAKVTQFVGSSVGMSPPPAPWPGHAGDGTVVQGRRAGAASRAYDSYDRPGRVCLDVVDAGEKVRCAGKNDIPRFLRASFINLAGLVPPSIS